MKDQRKTEIKVGITVFLGLVIFFWVLGWAKNWTLSSHQKEIKVEFSSVAGLEVGDPVTLNGVRKGYVKEIYINGNIVETVLTLPQDVSLKEDAKFSVMMLDLMGGKKIEIIPGTRNNEIDYSKTQKGEFLGDVASAMAMLGTVQNDLVEVIKEVKVSLVTINKTLTDQNFNADLKQSVSNLAILTDNLNKLVIANKEEITKLLKSGNELANNANDFMKANKDSLSQTITSINSVLKTSNQLLLKINGFMEKTENGQNNIGKLINDPEIISDLKLTIQQAKELTKILIDQLKSKGLEVNAHIF